MILCINMYTFRILCLFTLIALYTYIVQLVGTWFCEQVCVHLASLFLINGQIWMWVQRHCSKSNSRVYNYLFWVPSSKFPYLCIRVTYILSVFSTTYLLNSSRCARNPRILNLVCRWPTIVKFGFQFSVWSF